MSNEISAAVEDPPATTGTVVELVGLELRAGRRTLLKTAEARFEPGAITLIVGASGAGKSLLLRALAGLIEPDGEVQVDGRVCLNSIACGSAERSRRMGVVFQTFALFDELSPEANVQLAADHGRRPAAPPPASLLEELRIPRDVRTGALSGGQRQRLAIARTLAYDPEVILYDEPTSGLDRSSAQDVARLIASTHQAHPKTSIVVTHDYEVLAPIADRVYLLDSESHSLREIPPEQWADLGQLVQPVSRSVSETPSPRRGIWPRCKEAAVTGVTGTLAATSQVAEQLALLPLRLLPLWKSPRWGLRFLLHYLRLVAGPSAWLYISLAGAIAGFVTTYFTFRFLPFARYTEPLVIEDLLGSTGFALYRILIPVLAGILIAARCGAAVVSDVGAKSLGHQIDALRTVGARPQHYLLTNILYAFLLGTPLLTAIGYLAAAATSLIVFTATHPDQGPAFWQLHFHRELLLPGEVFYRGGYWVLSKMLVCGAGIALIAYYFGARRHHSSRDVSRAITSSIFWSTLFVLGVQFGFALGVF